MRIASIVGARPQFVKLAPIHRELCKRHEHLIVHTGQHYDYEMSQVFFEELAIPDPDHDLGIGSGTHGEQTGRMLMAIEEVLIEESPDAVLVYGDTNSTLAAALAAAKLHIPLAHVEAGLRSFNRRMPEEVNRVLTDHVSNLLFCPSEVARANLEAEGVTTGVHVVGDAMVQGLLELMPRLDPGLLDRFGVEPGEYVLATVHRQENADSRERMSAIVKAMTDCGETILLPLHPRTRKNLHTWGMLHTLEDADNVTVLPPLSFMAFTTLERFAKTILTDSGGVQKEAYTYLVPCVTMRDETEWVETLDEGWNVLVGADRKRIIEALASPPVGSTDGRTYGDLKVCERMVRALELL
jgi:UDP-N-acetylglucosamine 2-epimerase